MRSVKLSYGSSFLLLLAMLLFAGCTAGNKGKRIVGKRATGLPFEVVVVAESKYWDSILGEKIKEVLEQPYPALPQWEPSSRVSHCEPQHFNDFMRYVRNVLLVDVNSRLYTKTVLVTEQDVWATGQLVMRLQAPSSAELEKYLIAHEGQLNDLIREAEQRRFADYLTEYHSSFVDRTAQERFHVQVYVPEDFEASKLDSLFFWASNNANTGRMDLIIYEFPARGSEDLEASHLIAKRDSALKLNIPGSFPGTYMSTEKRFEVSCDPVKGSEVPSVLMRGLWRMEGDMMGGPFVSRALYDRKRQRIVVVEGFVYAPETQKKIYMHRLESALRTVRVL